MTEVSSMSAPLRWAVPFDGSEPALRALRLAMKEATQRMPKPELLVINVQLPLSADIARFIDGKTIDDFHREAGDKALRQVDDLLKGSDLIHSRHVLVGGVAHSIADFANSHGCAMIVMGTRGQGSVAGLLMGSVTTQLLHQTHLPVLLTR